jgi:hypothetical protein
LRIVASVCPDASSVDHGLIYGCHQSSAGALVVDLPLIIKITVLIESVAILRDQPSGADVRLWEIKSFCHFGRVDVSLFTLQHGVFKDSEGLQKVIADESFLLPRLYLTMDS